MIGEPVSAISFVQNYVELHFDGNILTARTPVSIVIRQQHFIFPETGSRDALCELIGRRAIDIVICDDDSITLTFDDSSTAVIPLGQEFRSGPEAAQFVPWDRQGLEIW